MVHMDKAPRPVWISRKKARWLTALAVVLPILSMLAGAAVAAHQYGVL